MGVVLTRIEDAFNLATAGRLEPVGGGMENVVLDEVGIRIDYEDRKPTIRVG